MSDEMDWIDSNVSIRQGNARLREAFAVATAAFRAGRFEEAAEAFDDVCAKASSLAGSCHRRADMINKEEQK